MKIMLVTDVPPDRQYTAGLVLHQLIRFMPEGSICCFAAINPYLHAGMSAGMDNVPALLVDKPIEESPAPRGTLERILNWCEEEWRQRYELPRIMRKAVQFAREQNVDVVWACLQGQSMIRMALPLARELGVPLRTIVWDPPVWFMKSHGVNRRSMDFALKQFDEAMCASMSCAVASWEMAEAYEARYSIPCVPVIASHDIAHAADPAPALHRKDRVTIGMAGQFYAIEAWHTLVAALQAAGWQIDGRAVHFRVLGHWLPDNPIPKDRIEFMGWQAHPNAIRLLSEADLLYCPYPFSPELAEVSRLSFPSKLVLYLAAGRPVVFHGPEWASPARYLLRNDAGFVCGRNVRSAIYGALNDAVTQTADYARKATNAKASFRKDFTLEKMRDNFYRFLDCTYDDLAADAVPDQYVMHKDRRRNAWNYPRPVTFIDRKRRFLAHASPKRWLFG